MKKTLLIIGIIAALLTQSVTVFATEDEEKIKAELIKKLDSAPISQCKDALVPIYDIELKQFFTFMDTTFQNKSSNSSLTNLAIARYQDFKENLNSLFAKVDINDPKNQDIAGASNAYILCGSLKDEYISTAKKMLFEHVKQTSATKTTAIMLEKYQAINSKLRDLNTAISQMYGYFMTFKNMLPGFLKQCVTSG